MSIPAHELPDEEDDKKKRRALPMHKHIANLALAVEFSTLGAVAVFLIATLAGQSALNFA